ncbi:unnamed protein product [Schistosoma rodhaini]|nr:unnamed protein product [Schistosoma rodhaini]
MNIPRRLIMKECIIPAFMVTNVSFLKSNDWYLNDLKVTQHIICLVKVFLLYNLQLNYDEDQKYAELEKKIAKIENEIPCLLEEMKSITEAAARATNEYVENQDASNKDELRQKFRNTSMSLSLVTYTIADKIEEIETLRFRLLGFLPSYERTQKVLNAMKRFVL